VQTPTRRRPPAPGREPLESLGWAGGEFGVDQAVDGLRVQYALENGDELELLEDVLWADWDGSGRLLVATRDGRLQIQRLGNAGHDVAFEVNLAELTPEPKPAPPSAGTW
jgi:hypothetical protein